MTLLKRAASITFIVNQHVQWQIKCQSLQKQQDKQVYHFTVSISTYHISLNFNRTSFLLLNLVSRDQFAMNEYGLVTYLAMLAKRMHAHLFYITVILLRWPCCWRHQLWSFTSFANGYCSRLWLGSHFWALLSGKKDKKNYSVKFNTELYVNYMNTSYTIL